jgi:hypothetical protein
MKRTKLMMLTLGLIVLFSFSFQVQADIHDAETMTLKGDIIDNMCASNHKDDMTEFVKTHTKACALMPNCVDSGYSLYVDGKLHKFDEASNKKIEEFLKKDDSKLQVEVTFAKKGDMISLVSIKNQ